MGTSHPSPRAVAGVHDQIRFAVDRFPIQAPVRCHHDDQVRLLEQRLERTGPVGRPIGVSQLRDQGIVICDDGPPAHQERHNVGGRCVTGVLDVRLEGHARARQER